jgi:hypothetical protein
MKAEQAPDNQPTNGEENMSETISRDQMDRLVEQARRNWLASDEMSLAQINVAIDEAMMAEGFSPSLHADIWQSLKESFQEESAETVGSNSRSRARSRADRAHEKDWMTRYYNN